MTQYSGVFTLQAQGQALTSGQWCTDPYYRNTTLLLHADNMSNGAQNNTFVDGSSNAFALTRNGNTTQGSFTPYGTTWSNYFPGDGSALTFPTNTAFAFGTGDVTIEAWIFDAGTTASYGQIIGASTYGVGNDFLFSFNGSTKTLFAQFGSSGGSASTGTVLSNTWTHVAVVKIGSTVTFYIDGISGGSYTDSDSVSSTITPTIGTSSNNNSDARFKGYISNVRITKGGALYTGTFFPSTTPLTTTVSAGTVSLLTCQSNRFIDNGTANSGSGFDVTVGGTPSVQRFSPFAPQYQYTPAVIGGSSYLDGSGDYLSAAQNAAFNLGTGQFTVECNVYWNGTGLSAGGYNLISLGYGANGGGPYTAWAIYMDFDFSAGGKPSFYRYDGTGYLYQSSSALKANQWNHIAVSRNSSNTLSMWVNGVRVYTGTVTTSFNNVNTNPLVIGYREDGGAGSPHYFPGYITDARVVVGSDVYGASNATITVPTAPLTAVSGTSFLTNCTNAGITDNAMMNNLETVGNAQVSTSVVKYGSGSLAFDGTGDYLVSNPASTDLYAFGTGDFTIEFWLYVNTVSGTQIVYDCRPTGTNGAQPIVFVDAGVVKFQHTSSVRITGPSLVTGTWYHIAVARSGTNTKMFVNGIQGGSTYTSDTTAYTNSSQRPIIGVDAANTSINPLNGYVDDLRITKGVARYTANFQPPKVAFANQ